MFCLNVKFSRKVIHFAKVHRVRNHHVQDRYVCWESLIGFQDSIRKLELTLSNRPSYPSINSRPTGASKNNKLEVIIGFETNAHLKKQVLKSCLSSWRRQRRRLLGLMQNPKSSRFFFFVPTAARANEGNFSSNSRRKVFPQQWLAVAALNSIASPMTIATQSLSYFTLRVWSRVDEKIIFINNLFIIIWKSKRALWLLTTSASLVVHLHLLLLTNERRNKLRNQMVF